MQMNLVKDQKNREVVLIHILSVQIANLSRCIFAIR